MDNSAIICTKDKIKQHLNKDIVVNTDINRTSTTNSINEQNDVADDYDSSDSLETASDEIPVWIYGEKRWISGVNEETSCSDLINVLLADEDVSLGNNMTSTSSGNNHHHNIHHHSTNLTNNKGFVITERWRRVEQILHDDTKILQIWSAWGHAKSEVKLTLRQLEPMPDQWQSNEQDSGMGSPNGSTSSAITRRRRHRASKSTIAWVTQAQTIHPKSQKATIEKLMKLILEQGETIQQQLAKLRDRELQIAKIEEDRHRVREREHGKNYLLETYLNGLHETDEKEIVTANSDSGVQTEGATSSPEISSCIQEDDDYIINSTNSSKYNKQEKLSHREKKLIKEHKNTKEFSTFLIENNLEQTETTDFENTNDLQSKIEWMEKLIVINKHLQREEELLVRLGIKIRKHETENLQLNEKQIHDALKHVNSNIETSNDEIQLLENDLLISNKKLQEKTNLLKLLDKELIDIENDLLNDNPLNVNNDEFVENLYSFSKFISKTNYDFNENNENRDHKNFLRNQQQHLHQDPHDIINIEKSSHLVNQQQQQQHQQPPPQYYDQIRIPPPAPFNDDNNSHCEGLLKNRQLTQAPIINCKQLNQLPLPLKSSGLVHQYLPEVSSIGIPSSSSSSTISSSSAVPSKLFSLYKPNPTEIRMSMNLLQKSDQKTTFNSNVYKTNTLLGGCKLGPKKLISKPAICNEFESNSDTGLSSLGEDVVHMGTLV